MQNTISICKSSKKLLPPEITNWNLESPSEKQHDSNSKHKIRGWVSGEIKNLKICVREEGAETWDEYVLSENRPDVIKKILNEAPEYHPQLTCGFNFKIDSSIHNFEIGLLINNNIHWIALIKGEKEENHSKSFFKLLNERLLSLKRSHNPHPTLPLAEKQNPNEKIKINTHSDISINNYESQELEEFTSSENFSITSKNGAKILKAGKVEIAGKGFALAEGENSYIVLSSNTLLAGTKINIRGQRSLVFIGQKCRLKGVTIQVNGDDCIVVIGAGTSWESGAALCSDGKAILIGDDCMFSSQVVLRTSDGHSIWTAGGTRQINSAENVIVEPHVWLGNSSRVSKGAIIGRGTIVGQLSLATGILKPYCIYGGIPARLIKENIEWSRTMNYNDIPLEHRLELDPTSSGANHNYKA